MLGYCTTVISLPCIKDGTIKDLVSSQAFNIGIQSNMNSLPCNKHMASSQGFDVVILYDSYKSSLLQRSGFKPGF